MKIKEPTGRLARWSIYLQAYSFDIVHRKGSKHTNVDALSRPVLSLEVQDDFELKEEDNIKITEIWEDDALIHYMKYGRHLTGLSNKQIKRVLNNAKSYCYKDEKIWYKRNGKELEVPRPEERHEIIIKAHLLGHFQKFSTYNRLKDKYFWRNMIGDIEKAIKRCDNCIRNQKVPEVNNPANTLVVEGIFDRVGIDLVFGLPETKEGYTGIMVITEYLTKYPYAKPIKSKTQEEVASVLLEYMSIFGPPKTILSDQGNEFNNQLMKRITNNLGVEHRVTSSYNPRTNGQTERFNQTLVIALRKHAEQNNQLWNVRLPYVLLGEEIKRSVFSNKCSVNFNTIFSIY